MSLALLFLYLMLSMFRMLIHPSSGAYDLFVELFHGLYCSGSTCVGVTLWFGCGGVVSVCRLKLQLKFPTVPFHLTSLHFHMIFATLLFLSLHTVYNCLPNSLSKQILALQGEVPNASAGSWFQFSMVLFTNEYFTISVLCFLSLIFRINMFQKCFCTNVPYK